MLDIAVLSAGLSVFAYMNQHLHKLIGTADLYLSIFSPIYMMSTLHSMLSMKVLCI